MTWKNIQKEVIFHPLLSFFFSFFPFSFEKDWHRLIVSNSLQTLFLSLWGGWSCHSDQLCVGRNGILKRVSDWQSWTTYPYKYSEICWHNSNTLFKTCCNNRPSNSIFFMSPVASSSVTTFSVRKIRILFLQTHWETDDRYLPTGARSSTFVTLYFPPISSWNLRPVTSSSRTQPLCINLNIDGVPMPLTPPTHKVDTNLSPPIHFPLLRYPLSTPFPRSTRIDFVHFDTSLSITCDWTTWFFQNRCLLLW